MDVIGRPKEAHRWYKGGRSIAKIDTNVDNSAHYFTERPMGDPCASILRPRRYVCLPPASLEPLMIDRPPRWPLCDCLEHAQNLTATMASMVTSERPVCHPWTTKANLLPPLFLQSRPGQLCGRTKEAQMSLPCVKGGISSVEANIANHMCRQTNYVEVSTNFQYK